MSTHVTDVPLSFGALLKRFRRQAGLHQPVLARLTGYTAGYLSKLERGARRPAPVTIEALARALGLTAGERGLFAQAAHEAAHEAAHVGRDVSPAVSWPVAQPLRETATPPPRAVAVAAGPLVGRRRELASIEELLSGGVSRALLLAGEPGIGKSRLLRAAAERGRATGWTVIESGCLRHDGQEPFAPLVAALERIVRQTPPDALGALLAGCGWLVRLVPELDELVPAPARAARALAPARERRLVHDAMAHFLGNLAGPAGTLLVLDDLQWAGAGTIDLLASLMRLPADQRLRLIGAYRHTEPAAPADRADRAGSPELEGVAPASGDLAELADLVGAGLARQVTLDPLAEDEAGTLLDVMLPRARDGRLRAALAWRAGGVPFFLVSCARAVAIDTSSGERDAVGVPWEVAQTIRQRLGALPETARIPVRIIAIAGQEIAYAVLLKVARALGQREAEMVRGIAHANHAGLLAERGDACYAIRYALMREVIEADLGAAQRARLHRLIAEALIKVEADPSLPTLAHHYLHAGIPARLVKYLRKAGDDAAARGAHREAADCYRDLAQRLDEINRPVEAARVRLEHAHALFHLNEYAQALSVLERASGAFQAAHRPDDLAQATTAMGWTYAALSRPAEGIARIQGQIKRFERAERLSDRSRRTRAALFISLARLHFVAGDYGLQLAAAQRATDLAQQIGHSWLIAQALTIRAEALDMLNYADDGLVLLERKAIPLAERTEDHWTLAQALDRVAGDYLVRGEFTLSRAYAVRALKIADQLHDPALSASLTLRRGTIDYYLGRWASARRALQKGQAMLQYTESPSHRPYALIGLARLALAQGRWEQASEQFDEGIKLAEQLGDLPLRRHARGLLAERELLRDDPGRALSVLSLLEPLLDRSPQQRETDVTALLPLVAWAYLVRGEVCRAAELTAAAIERARDGHLHYALTDALRVRAQVALRQGQWAEAQAAVDEGLERLTRMPYPYAEAKLLYVSGQLAGAQGAAVHARERLAAALAILAQLGERLYAERVECALTSLTPSG
ncbi:MAG TPA: AAA family ATPase [Ktedonobacterales bacterium]|nr:AAA family ATPase [Ktedonobacterales bacterium]